MSTSKTSPARKVHMHYSLTVTGIAETRVHLKNYTFDNAGKPNRISGIKNAVLKSVKDYGKLAREVSAKE
jgi:hypothetical protein